MAALDFVQFIKDNTSMAAIEQTAMLDDFCSAFGMDDSADKKAFANERITRFVAAAINRTRRRDAQIDQFELVNGTVVLP